MALLQHFQSHIALTAFEFFSDKALQAVLSSRTLNAPFNDDYPLYVLLEFDATSEAIIEWAEQCFAHCAEQGWTVDAVISQNQRQYADLWQLREGISEALSPRLPYKNDISVKLSDIPAFLAEVDRLVEENYPSFEVVWYGHIGDGNLHLNILKPTTMTQATFIQHCEQVNPQLFNIVQKYQGSISAEHGVGLLKRDYLHYTRSAEEICHYAINKSCFRSKQYS